MLPPVDDERHVRFPHESSLKTMKNSKTKYDAHLIKTIKNKRHEGICTGVSSISNYTLGTSE